MKAYKLDSKNKPMVKLFTKVQKAMKKSKAETKKSRKKMFSSLFK